MWSPSHLAGVSRDSGEMRVAYEAGYQVAGLCSVTKPFNSLKLLEGSEQIQQPDYRQPNPCNPKHLFVTVTHRG